MTSNFSLARLTLPALAILITTTACAPKIYVIDKQTVLEEEAAGDWPDFEKDLVKKSASGDPTPYKKVPVNARRARLYNVLNGEMLSQAEGSAVAAPKEGAAK